MVKKKSTKNTESQELLEHPVLTHGDTNQKEAYYKKGLSKDEYEKALIGRYKDMDRYDVSSMIDNSAHNTPDVNEKIDLAQADPESLPGLKVSSNKIKELSNAGKHEHVNSLYDPEEHTAPSLFDVFQKNGDQQNLIRSVQNSPLEKLPEHSKVAANLLLKNPDLYHTTAAATKIFAAQPGLAKEIVQKRLKDGAKRDSGYQYLPDSVKHQINDHFLGIKGGKRPDSEESPEDQLSDDENYDNWEKGPGYSPRAAKWLAENGSLTDAQADHIARHGGHEQKFKMFHENSGFDPAIKTRMFQKWKDDDSHHGYGLDEYKNSFIDKKQDSVYDDYALRDQAEEEAKNDYTIHDYYANVNRNAWRRALEDNDHDEEAAQAQFINDEFDGNEERAWEGYDEAISDSVNENMYRLAQKKYGREAFEHIDHLPDDMVAHPSFEPHANEIRGAREATETARQEAKIRKEAPFHNERIPERETEHLYGQGQHQAELLRDMAKANGGSVDIGTMHKLYPNLKETWKSIFGPKGKLTTDEIQAHIDEIPKTKWNISHGKWNKNAIQNLNGQDQTIFRLDHSDDTMAKLDAAGVKETFNKVADLSRRSGHPTNAGTVGWARVDTTNPKHWVIDETQTDYGKGVREFLKDHDKEDKADDIDKIMQIQGGWHEALVNHVLKMAKKHGVEKVSTHTPESKAAHTGAESIHTVYKDAYGAMPNYGFQKVDAEDVDSLTKQGKESIGLIKNEPDQQEIHYQALKHANAADMHLHNAFHQQKMLESHGESLGLIDKGKLHAGIALSKEMASKHKEAGLKLDPENERLKDLKIEPTDHSGSYGSEENPLANTSDHDKMLKPQKIKKQKMQTIDLTGKLPSLKKSNTIRMFAEKLYSYHEHLRLANLSASWLKKSHEDAGQMVLNLAQKGFWPSAMKAADAIKRSPKYPNIYAQLAGLESKVPPEYFKEFLSKISHPWSPEKSDANALSELSHNLHPELAHEHLDILAHAAPDDQDIQENLKNHLGWAPASSESYMNKLIPHAFWHSYETSARPEHFAIASRGLGHPDHKESHKAGNPLNLAKAVLSWRESEETPSANLFTERASPGLVASKNAAEIPVFEIQKRLKQHAGAHQRALLDSYYRGNPHGLELKTFGGKQYIKLYRGVGSSAGQILGKLGYNPEEGSIENKTLVAPSAPFSHWSISKDMAADAADHDGPSASAIVIEQWLPVENILHTGVVKAHPALPQANSGRGRVIIHHPNLKHEIRATDVNIVQPGGQMLKPKVVKKG